MTEPMARVVHFKPTPVSYYWPCQGKTVNIKVQEEPKAELAANPLHQEEEKKWHYFWVLF